MGDESTATRAVHLVPEELSAGDELRQQQGELPTRSTGAHGRRALPAPVVTQLVTQLGCSSS